MNRGARARIGGGRRGAALAVGLVIGTGLVFGGCGTVAAPPRGDAARVVPAVALAYVHLALDGDAPAQAAASGATLPGYRRLLTGVESRLARIAGVSYAGGIRPWLGHEAALALVPDGSGSASEEIVLGVRDRPAAQRFLRESRAPATRLIDGLVVLGVPSAVAAAAAAGAGAGDARRSLAALPAFRRAAAARPGVLSAFLTARGIDALLGGRRGILGVLASALSGARTVGAALTPTGDGFRVAAALYGRPARVRFSPTLMGALPPATTWAIDLPSLTGSMPGVLEVLAGAGAGDGPVGGLVSRLGSALAAQGVDPAPLAAQFGGQAALFGLAGGIGLLAATRDPAAARREIGLAGAALASLLAPVTAAGAEPVVVTATVAGTPVTAYAQGTSMLELALVDGRIAITTSLRTMQALITGGHGLSGTARYASVLGGAGPSAGPVLFGDVNQLVAPASRAGLLESLGLAGLGRLLGRISAAGLTSGGGSSYTTAELYITIP